MKRIILSIIGISMLLSVMMVSAAANEIPGYSVGLQDTYTNVLSEKTVEIHLEDYIAENMIECPTIDLVDKVSTMTIAESEYSVFGNEEPLYLPLDFSNALSMSDALSGEMSIPLALPENQPPVAQPEILLMNPETMRDGQYTTDTWFFIATRWNNTDLCYDPEGGPLYLTILNNFPKGYVTYVADPNGTWAGFRIWIFNKGNYPLEFVFEDSYGGTSQTFFINLEIISRGVFETFEGTITSTAPESHQITVDYSVSDEYCITFLRTGTVGFDITVLNPDGTKCGAGYVSSEGASQDIKKSITLPKPDNVTGSCTYTVVITGQPSNDASYKVAYGPSNQRYYFFEDVSDSIDLPYYYSVRNLTQQTAAQYVSRSALSDYGDYFKIVATGTERVTLSSTFGNYCFKVLDGTTLETLYDGRNLETYHADQYSSYYKRISLNFTEGSTYYIVVYDPDETASRGSYSIMVGEPKMDFQRVELDIPATSFVKGTSYVWTFNLSTPTGLPGYIDEVFFSGSQAGWPFEDGHFSVLTPGESSWRTNTLYYSRISFGYDNVNAPLVNAVGQWKFKITAGKTGEWPGSTLSIRYWFGI